MTYVIDTRTSDDFRSPPIEITEEKWMEMLCVLPPEDWCKHSGGESFKLMEYTYADITGIYAIVDGRHWHMADSANMPHVEIVARIRGKIEADHD